MMWQCFLVQPWLVTPERSGVLSVLGGIYRSHLGPENPAGIEESSVHRPGQYMPCAAAVSMA